VNDEPLLTSNADLANRRGRVGSPSRPVSSAAEFGLVGSATTPRTGRTSRPRRRVPIPFTHCNVADDVKEPGRAVGAGTGWPWSEEHPARGMNAAASTSAANRTIPSVSHRFRLPPIGRSAHGQRHERSVQRADGGFERLQRLHGLSAKGESEEGIDRGFERTDVPLNLGD
jgi:hypothetical protein